MAGRLMWGRVAGGLGLYGDYMGRRGAQWGRRACAVPTVPSLQGSRVFVPPPILNTIPTYLVTHLSIPHTP